MVRAVITAGGRVDDAFAAAIGTRVKALAPLGTGVLLDRILAAIAGAGIAEIAVVADPAAGMRLPENARLVPAAPSGAANVALALDAWPDDDLLFATSDLPFVTAAELVAFLAASADCDLTMPLAAAAAYEAAFPGAPPHIMTLCGERIAGGSVFFIGRDARAQVRAIAGRFFDARKSAVGMARLLGPALLLRYLVRRLRIAHVEQRAASVFGVRAAAIRDSGPGLSYDVDTLADYRYACAHR
jgi:GTP:adenosylcobinamide-phosphate guanylyltransferase